MPRKRPADVGGLGKAPPSFLKGEVFRNLGRKRGGVLVGPGVGLDNAILSLPGGSVMAVTTDPVSMIPALGAPLSAWLSVHLVASDLTASGVDPEYATFSYNFPEAMPALDVSEYLRALGSECGKLGVSIVGGNTGRYPGGGFTVIGAGTMIGISTGPYVTPAMARVGDAVLVTKHAAIEATATLAGSFPNFLRARVGGRTAKKAADLVRLCTTVEDARAAREAGLGPNGVTAMHDATEGGVLGALAEVANASGSALAVDPLKIPVSEEARAVCTSFGIDPLSTMGEGALVVTCAPRAVQAVEAAMADRSIDVARVGVVTHGQGLLLEGGGRKTRYRPPLRDPFWESYDGATTRGLT